MTATTGSQEASEDTMPDRGLRSSGMRDLGPEEMARFRRVERCFLEVVSEHGYREIRTPAIEPLHLFTASGALSPQLLDRAYSFLDWDGWSGERVVLRPDTTVPAARWYVERQQGDGPARLCYVQPVYRFASDDASREHWQCGVELFGVAAPEADAELLILARDFLVALGLEGLHFEIAHAGLVRAVLAAAGFDAAGQIAAYDRLLEGNGDTVEELMAERPQATSALRLLSGVEGAGSGYVANLRAALLPAVPDAEEAVAELEAAAVALDGAGCAYELRPIGARPFEYYTGITFALSADGVECITGGRYDGLGEALGGGPSPACGFGADLLRLAALAPGGDER